MEPYCQVSCQLILMPLTLFNCLQTQTKPEQSKGKEVKNEGIELQVVGKKVDIEEEKKQTAAQDNEQTADTSQTDKQVDVDDDDDVDIQI